MNKQARTLRVELIPSGNHRRVILVKDLKNVEDVETGKLINDVINCADCGRLHRVSNKEWEFEYDADIDSTKSVECGIFSSLTGESWTDLESAKAGLQEWYNKRRGA